jgi:hypothetical protein
VTASLLPASSKMLLSGAPSPRRRSSLFPRIRRTLALSLPRPLPAACPSSFQTRSTSGARSSATPPVSLHRTPSKGL